MDASSLPTPLKSSLDFARHPCFNPAAKGSYGRVHLPVAPKCNIKCNYCNRKYDCVNESRPGVTSTVLTPHQALVYLEKVLAKEPRISVAGIAGPGDPFANAENTMETLQLIRKRFPEMILCLASNGMALAPFVPELAKIRVSHVTVTVNAVDPAIGEKIYGWVRDGNVVYRGRQAAELLLSRQMEAIAALKQYGITVKVNTIVIPGINDGHILDVAEVMKGKGVDLLNCMALFPNAGTAFAHIPQPNKETMARIRNNAEKYLPQMRHCTRCRADAVGLLEDDKTHEFRGCLSACAALPSIPTENRPYVAVASLEGVLINQHLGEAKCFQIWGYENGKAKFLEERVAPEPGGGIKRWHQLARLLYDCRAVLVNDLGESPRSVLEASGIKPITISGFIEDGVTGVFEGSGLDAMRPRRLACSKGGCTGSGKGCG